MLRHVILLLFLYGIKDGSGSSAQDGPMESKGVVKTGIKKTVGANGLDENSKEMLRNFRNPVLEYLLSKGSDRTVGGPKRGIVREIRHSQTLLVPNFPGGIRPLPEFLVNQLPQLEGHKKPAEDVTGGSPLDNIWNYLKNKTGSPGGIKSHESIVTSPVLHLNKNPESKGETTRVQMYPAVAVIINTFNKDGTLKNSVTHFQPDFNSLGSGKNEGATFDDGINRNFNTVPNTPEGGSDLLRDPVLRQRITHRQEPRQGVSWPFAGYFPIVINDPFLSVYNAFASSMYNAVSSMVEYGPEADICRKDHEREAEKEEGSKKTPERYQRKDKEDVEEEKEIDSDIFDEVTMRTQSFDRKSGQSSGRMRRDATSIFLKTRQGDRIDLTLEEPLNVNGVAEPDERARSFNPVLVNTPPLSTVMKPPHHGYADKKRKSKPTKPMKEEGNSEEVGEEHEEESTGQTQESANEAVAISPPPEGASVAEAKPIGLAIAGPGGVAASKPQGTAVAGPGGLAIARPVGTAIAGVEVEGSVPIGGQQKQNKKKPKQEQEQTEGELHYVGGLTGPIGNPQPKEFTDGVSYKSVRETQGNNIQDNLFFRGRHNSNGYQIKLGQQNGKYGFIPMFASPVQGTDRLQKRMDSPTFFHGLLGNNAQGNDQFQNYQMQF